MTLPNKAFEILILIVIFLISSLITFLSWGFAHYFLSKRDHYVNSKYQLFLKKLGWAISVFFTTLGLFAVVINKLFK